MRQKILWVDDSAVSEPNIDLPDDADFQINDYFRDEFHFADWTRVLIIVDVTGNDRAMAWADPAGPPELDFVNGHKDPFWRYVDDNQTELNDLGRRVYG